MTKSSKLFFLVVSLGLHSFHYAMEREVVSAQSPFFSEMVDRLNNCGLFDQDSSFEDVDLTAEKQALSEKDEAGYTLLMHAIAEDNAVLAKKIVAEVACNKPVMLTVAKGGQSALSLAYNKKNNSFLQLFASFEGAFSDMPFIDSLNASIDTIYLENSQQKLLGFLRVFKNNPEVSDFIRKMLPGAASRGYADLVRACIEVACFNEYLFRELEKDFCSAREKAIAHGHRDLIDLFKEYGSFAFSAPLKDNKTLLEREKIHVLEILKTISPEFYNAFLATFGAKKCMDAIEIDTKNPRFFNTWLSQKDGQLFSLCITKEFFNESVPKKLFALAHELGHLYLKHPKRLSDLKKIFKESDPIYRDARRAIEFEADSFALTRLGIPLPFCLEALERLQRDCIAQGIKTTPLSKYPPIEERMSRLLSLKHATDTRPAWTGVFKSLQQAKKGSVVAGLTF